MEICISIFRCISHAQLTKIRTLVNFMTNYYYETHNKLVNRFIHSLRINRGNFIAPGSLRVCPFTFARLAFPNLILGSNFTFWSVLHDFSCKHIITLVHTSMTIHYLKDYLKKNSKVYPSSINIVCFTTIPDHPSYRETWAFFRFYSPLYNSLINPLLSGTIRTSTSLTTDGVKSHAWDPTCSE